jgi:hypothetical protein
MTRSSAVGELMTNKKIDVSIADATAIIKKTFFLDISLFDGRINDQMIIDNEKKYDINDRVENPSEMRMESLRDKVVPDVRAVFI